MSDLATILVTAWAVLVVLDLFLLTILVHDLIEARRPVPPETAGGPSTARPPGRPPSLRSRQG